LSPLFLSFLPPFPSLRVFSRSLAFTSPSSYPSTIFGPTSLS
jgi:hypothetical protein